MSVRADLSGLQPQALVEMFIFDARAVDATAPVLRWHPGTQIDRDPIVWQGFTYEAFPVETEGFEQTSAGKLPRPVLRAANIGGTLGAYLRTIKNNGLRAKVTRKRTLAKYLDAVNFPGGNPNADPTADFEDEIFYLARKAAENPIFIEFELAVAFDVSGILLPRRQVIAGTCQWIYRQAECSYTGPAIKNDPIYPDPAATTATDKCGKGLSSCKLRFGNNGVLPTSAFPSSLLARYV